jgi:lipopolysaccharide export LptBFGC system permease protein LptF
MKSRNLIDRLTFGAAAAFLWTGTAFAGGPVPGPVVGAGAPALVLLAGGYWLLRRRRTR